ncbi:glycosyltransferase [Thermaurantiacus sp.]
MAFTLAVLSLLAWTYLAGFRHGFWRTRERLAPAPAPAQWPEVAVLVPARNEAAQVGEVVTAHMASTYPGDLSLILVDDGSTDGTAERARAAAASGARPFHLVPGTPLPPGWTGKLWALETALEAAAIHAPGARWLLLTDADIRHGPELLARLVARAEAADLALLSVMARLDCRGFWGGLLIPAFLYFFQKLYPFAAVNSPRSRIAGAAGGVVLLRRKVLAEIGGFAALRGALIDDCTLAALVKSGPPRRAIALVLADDFASALSLRDNRAFRSVRDMVARTAFAQLRHSPLLLLATLAGLALVYLVPPLVALAWPLHGNGTAAVLAMLAWALMTFTYVPTLRYCGLSPIVALTLPLAAAFYAGFTALSALRHWRGRGGQWKGRTYPAA